MSYEHLFGQINTKTEENDEIELIYEKYEKR